MNRGAYAAMLGFLLIALLIGACSPATPPHGLATRSGFPELTEPSTASKQGAPSPIASTATPAPMPQPQRSWGPIPAANVELVGQIGGTVNAVALQGQYAYIGEGPRLTILDVSDPASPALAGTTELLPDIVTGVAVAGQVAYIVERSCGIRVIDLSVPGHPAAVGSCIAAAEAISIAGRYAYAAGGTFTVLDLADPLHPTKIGQYDSSGFASSVAAVDSFAYVADADGGLRVVDVSTPSEPKEVGFLQMGNHAEGVAVSGHFAYLADSYTGVHVIDVSDPAAPTEVGQVATSGQASGVTVVDNVAYVADNDGGLLMLDVSDPPHPRSLAVFDSAGRPANVATSGNLAYVAAGPGGLRVVDVSSPAEVREIGYYARPGWVDNIAVAGQYAYVAGSRALHVLDLADPAHPVQAAVLALPGDPQTLAVGKHYAYVYVPDTGYMRIDISEPTRPALVPGASTATESPYVVVNWNAVYDQDGFALGTGATIMGHYLLMNSEHQGLQIKDISTPASSQVVGTYGASLGGPGIAVAGHYAFVADGGEGVRVLDVTDPTEPREVASAQTPGAAKDVEVDGAYVYAADQSGLSVLDVSTPDRPAPAGFYATPGWGTEVAISGGLVYLAENEGGLTILRFTGGRLLSISGQIKDEQGQPTPGVVVSAAWNRSADTDEEGRYTVSWLPAGAYQLTAYREGWSFKPEALTVKLDADAKGKDFVARFGLAASGTAPQTGQPDLTTPEGELPGGWIATVESTFGGYEGIAIMRATGWPSRRLGVKGYGFHWSSDGQWLAFVGWPEQVPEEARSEQWPYRTQVFIVRYSGSALAQLTKDSEDIECVAWSPDGQSIAYRSSIEGYDYLFEVSRDGSRQRQLTFDKTDDGCPIWLPDGHGIVFQREEQLCRLDPVSAQLQCPAFQVDWWAQLSPEEQATLSQQWPGVEDIYRQWPTLPIAQSPDGRWLALAGLDRIWQMKADGSGLAPLTAQSSPLGAGSTSGAWPAFAWSPDRKWVAYFSNQESDISDSGGLWVSRIDGGQPTLISTDAQEAAWSPVSEYADLELPLPASHIAYIYKQNVCFVESNGWNNHCLTHDPWGTNNQRPSLSPDGQWIAFFSSTADQSEVQVMRTDGSDRHRLVAGSMPTWSPDSQWIAFVSETGELRLIHPDGTGEQAVPGTESIWGGTPFWSPDGRWIGFGEGFRLWAISRDGGERYQMVGSQSDQGAWSPNGDWLAFRCPGDEDRWEICVARADGTQLTRLTHLPSGGWADTEGPCWSPDGEWIAFYASLIGSVHTAEPWEGSGMYVMRADGSDLTRLPLEGEAPTWSR